MVSDAYAEGLAEDLRLCRAENAGLREALEQHLKNAVSAHQTLAAHRSSWVREVGRKIKERGEWISREALGEKP